MANSPYTSSLTGPNLEAPARILSLSTGNTSGGTMYTTLSSGVYIINVDSSNVISVQPIGSATAYKTYAFSDIFSIQDRASQSDTPKTTLEAGDYVISVGAGTSPRNVTYTAYNKTMAASDTLTTLKTAATASTHALFDLSNCLSGARLCAVTFYTLTYGTSTVEVCSIHDLLNDNIYLNYGGYTGSNTITSYMVAGNRQKDIRMNAITNSSTTLLDVYNLTLKMASDTKHYLFDVSALSMANMNIVSIKIDKTNLLYTIFDISTGYIAEGVYSDSTLLTTALGRATELAKIDGYYPQMHVGVADNLYTTIGYTGEKETYLFRTTAEGESVTTGPAEDETYYGGTWFPNQFVDFDNVEAYSDNGITCTKNSDGSFTFNGTATANYVFDLEIDRNQLIAGHKYLTNPTISNAAWNTICMKTEALNGSARYLSSNAIFTAVNSCSGTTGAVYYVWISYEYTVTNIKIYPMLIDLTQWFGAGNEPTTVDEFILRTGLIGLPYVDYQTAAPACVNPNNRAMVGLNQWDEQWELGSLNTSTGADATSSSNIRSKNYIPILKNQSKQKEYYFTPLAKTFYVCEYDANKNFLRSVQVNANAESGTYSHDQIFSDDVYYIRFYVAQTSYANDICINLAWSGTMNGTYEAYSKLTMPLTLGVADATATKYYGPGLNGIWGSYVDEETRETKYDFIVRDEETPNLLTRRVGKYTFTGNETIGNWQDGTFFFAGLQSIIAIPANGAVKANIAMANLATAIFNIRTNTNNSVSVYGVHATYGGYVFFYSSSITTAAAWQTYLKDKTIYFELATPITTTKSPASEWTHTVNDWGTEAFEYASGVFACPPTVTCLYQDNIKDNARRLIREEGYLKDAYDIESLDSLTETKDGYAKIVKTEVESNHYTEGWVGLADQLYDPNGTKDNPENDADNNPFLYRSTGGSTSVDTGVAEFKQIRGRSLVMNQIIPDNYVHRSGTQGSSEWLTSPNFTLYNGHKYLLTRKGKFTINANGARIVSITGTTIIYSAVTGKSGVVFSCTETRNNYFYQSYINGGDVYDFYMGLYDLTLMYGKNNEPTDYTTFAEDFPLDYYAYNTGEIINVKTNGIKTVGFNQFDEQIEEGTIDINTGEPTTSTSDWRFKNFIPILASTSYYINLPQTSTDSIAVFYYDGSQNYISRAVLSSPNVAFTTVAGAAYLKMAFSKSHYGTAYANNICLNLSWSGKHNNTDNYESYVSYTKDLPVLSYFEDGMNGFGTVYDELNPGSYVKRFAKVDLGTLNWSLSGTNYFSTDGLINSIKAIGASVLPNAACSKYVCDTWNSIYGGTKGLSVGDNSRLYVKDTTYSTAADFKDAMDGVYLVYELATSTTTTISPELSMSYNENDWGTEEFLFPSTATGLKVPCMIEYKSNLVDKLRNMNELTTDELNEILALLD